MIAPRMNRQHIGPLCVLIVLAGWAMAALAIPALPARIPTHFGIDGSVDATGSPASLWTLPIVQTVIYVFLTALQFVPADRLNVPVTITDRNRDRVYALAHGLMRAVRIGALLTVLCVEWATIHAAGSGALDAPFYIATVAPVIALFGWIGSYLVRMARA